jgi:bacterioferritin-associated ferredoxin
MPSAPASDARASSVNASVARLANRHIVRCGVRARAVRAHTWRCSSVRRRLACTNETPSSLAAVRGQQIVATTCAGCVATARDMLHSRDERLGASNSEASQCLTS